MQFIQPNIQICKTEVNQCKLVYPYTKTGCSSPNKESFREHVREDESNQGSANYAHIPEYLTKDAQPP